MVARGKYLVTHVLPATTATRRAKMGDNGPGARHVPDAVRASRRHDAPAAAAALPAHGSSAARRRSPRGRGPWGISYTANLTPDKETGLGTWTAQQFLDTIRNGRVQGHGRQLLPPMPWPMYRNMTDSDLRAIFAYLQTIPAVKNKVPDPIMAPPPPAK